MADGTGPTTKKDEYCCKMREKYIVSIVAVNTNLPDPVDVIDFLNFEIKSPNGHPVLFTRYCAWCGVLLPKDRRRMIDLPKDEDGDGEEWKAGTVD